MYLLYTINCKHEENLRLLILHPTEASSVNVSIDILRILLFTQEIGERQIRGPRSHGLGAGE